MRVVTQVRFPAILAIASETYVSDFQEQLRGDYPLLERELQAAVRVSENEISKSEGSVVWRLSDPEERYQVSLASGFLALQANAYSTREDFINRWKRVLTVAASTIKPLRVGRYGIRYVDQLTDPKLLEHLDSYVRGELVGLAGVDLNGVDLSRVLTEAEFELPDRRRLKARWGLVPQSGEESEQPETPDRVWVLDLDGFITERPEFSVSALTGEAWHLSDVIYRFFRWATTDNFIRHFGGKP